MLDFFHLPQGVKADVQVFGPTSISTGVGLQTWNKPRGCSMVAIFGVGAGGNGGNGAVGAAGAAAGGGGGGSGAQVFVVLPASMLPGVLFCSVVHGGSQTYSTVSLTPDSSIANNRVLLVNGGNSGNNASGATPGSAGVGGPVTNIASVPIVARGVFNFLVGVAGSPGNAASVPAGSLATSGVTLSGGTGGGGVTATIGGNGGSINAVAGFALQIGGLGAQNNSTPGANGSNGHNVVVNGLRYSYGGTGGGASHSTAAGAGLFGGNGGAGGIGCGGGGGGGCLTGGVAGVGGKGGPGQITMIAW